MPAIEIIKLCSMVFFFAFFSGFGVSSFFEKTISSRRIERFFDGLIKPPSNDLIARALKIRVAKLQRRIKELENSS
ncbi:hypothetical protein JD974_12110 [Chromobacterium haemolyticum]|uniref:Uncharacterized protein n=1 Tax=Chromobacterium haemolyticum TaxID=394935 RepID=A0ABS3GPF6_9NEIS|nr:hypothetical protein [Chromobacterium haemolyticum]MBK0415148.1 hypothetical protein [Chromobacterium haemolyticum]MBO0416638.1 hypothetical protein [Chromobacterium haemolyticum]MBO0499786.1 hypothetical protein [Chromobacterium haemolyticum]